MNKEFRTFNISNDDESRKVGGYAIVFNSLSVDLGGFREIISPDAVTQDLIDRSDVIFNFNHQNDIVLGRSRNGEGTLSLRLDDKGLYFECELPNSPMGDNIRESIKRGDISQCSFAFTINQEDEGAETWENREDGIYRTINRIAGLYDVSAVTFPAYEETSISERAKNILNDMKKEEIELREEEVKEPEEEQEQKACEDEKEDERAEEPEDEKSEEEKAEDPEDEETEEEPSDEEEKTDEESDVEENRQKNLNIKKMEKRFSLVKAIRNIANHKQLDPAEQAVVNAGAEAMRNADQGFGGDIQIPVGMELRDDPVHYTVEADGEHVVVTDYLNILEPLRANNVLVQAGAHFMSGLKGNVQLPIGTDVNVFWEGEITEAQNGAGSFSHVTLSPKRISAVIPLSLQLLAQDTLDVEGYVRNLLVTKINEKLEATILGEAAASGNAPAGIFNGVSATEVSDFADICELESDLEDSNFNGPKTYIVSPKAKAALRSMIKGTNATGMVMENGEVDGTPAYETTHMTTEKFAVGQWSELYIGQWGALDLTIDETSQREKGIIRLIVNAFFDYKVVREGAIVYGEIASE